MRQRRQRNTRLDTLFQITSPPVYVPRKRAPYDFQLCCIRWTIRSCASSRACTKGLSGPTKRIQPCPTPSTSISSTSLPHFRSRVTNRWMDGSRGSQSPHYKRVGTLQDRRTLAKGAGLVYSRRRARRPRRFVGAPTVEEEGRGCQQGWAVRSRSETDAGCSRPPETLR
ncbi:hypothetical protein EXIGLDRAFT_266343 [Exidia glandulosa HHB12029]|uniref:Uncharacterized protein n=1 Tax=Exidia glandulosa HHB12029 TaxID=1314781 RepID=A0A165MAF9_EXIGL|nr:hypothetical protein EXIGLDRAFT_266343 [Exidia glandulosa HHB12029]